MHTCHRRVVDFTTFLKGQVVSVVSSEWEKTMPGQCLCFESHRVPKVVIVVQFDENQGDNKFRTRVVLIDRSAMFLISSVKATLAISSCYASTPFEDRLEYLYFHSCG